MKKKTLHKLLLTCTWSSLAQYVFPYYHNLTNFPFCHLLSTTQDHSPATWNQFMEYFPPIQGHSICPHHDQGNEAWTKILVNYSFVNLSGCAHPSIKNCFSYGLSECKLTPTTNNASVTQYISMPSSSIFNGELFRWKNHLLDVRPIMHTNNE